MVTVHVLGISQSLSYGAFHILHPAHLLLSSTVSAAVFRRHGGALTAILVGILGALAICTLSDVLIPYLGGAALGASMELHLDIFLKPWLVFPPALAGAALGALLLRWTRCPHAAHVMISTLASLFYLMAFPVGVVDWLPRLPLVFVVLFVAVWVPCCTSDVVFPHLFVAKVKHR